MNTSGEQDLIGQLHRCGLRATSQRLSILRALRNDRSHPSAEAIYNRLKPSYPTLSLSTVYKTLQTLADLGVIYTIDTGTGKQRFDGRLAGPHHHAVCTRCGKVFDVSFDDFPVTLPDRDIVPGFSVQSVQVYFSGHCLQCDTSDPSET